MTNLSSFRTLSIAAAALTLAASANAAIDWSDKQGTSTLAFSPAAISLFQANNGKVSAAGNTVAVNAWTYKLPITSITISSSLKVSAGSAVGSAIIIKRTEYDENDTPITRSITLANFTLNYATNQVLADVTPKGGVTSKQMVVYNFHQATPLGLKYKFPLTITGHEVLDKLMLTPAAVTMFANALNLNGVDVLKLVAETDFGTLTQDISTSARKPAVSTKPYVATP